MSSSINRCRLSTWCTRTTKWQALFRIWRRTWRITRKLRKSWQSDLTSVRRSSKSIPHRSRSWSRRSAMLTSDSRLMKIRKMSMMSNKTWWTISTSGSRRSSRNLRQLLTTYRFRRKNTSNSSRRWSTSGIGTAKSFCCWPNSSSRLLNRSLPCCRGRMIFS